MPWHSIDTQVVRGLYISNHSFSPLRCTSCVRWFHPNLFSYLDSGWSLLIDFLGCISRVPPFIVKNWSMRHCVISLSDLGSHVVPEYGLFRWYPSPLSYCFHRPMMSLHYSISSGPIGCPVIASYLPFFLALSGRFLSEKQCHCPLSPQLRDHVQASPFPIPLQLLMSILHATPSISPVYQVHSQSLTSMLPQDHVYLERDRSIDIGRNS